MALWVSKGALRLWRGLQRPWCRGYHAVRMGVWEKAWEKSANVPLAVSKVVSWVKSKDIIQKVDCGKDTPLELLQEMYGRSSVKKAHIAIVNGVLWDLTRPIESETNTMTLDALDFDGNTLSGNVVPNARKMARSVFWHSAAHVLGCALESHFGESVMLDDGPPLEKRDGFYYDFTTKEVRTVTPEDYRPLTVLMRKMIGSNVPFERLVVDKSVALDMFRGNEHKVVLLDKIPKDQVITVYRCGQLIDLCRGPHIPSTGWLGGVEVTHSSASTITDAHGEVQHAQRVYGIAFPNATQLVEWKRRRKEQNARDHRKIGKEQRLFLQHRWSPGSPVFLPHGTRILNRIWEFLRKEYTRRGYEEVKTPLMYDAALWKQSGHLDHYQEDMYMIEQGPTESSVGLKPMNCPVHCLIFDAHRRSHADLPLRLSDFTSLHRNEVSGALKGLTRVRLFHQDDGHIFCTEDQVDGEIDACLEFVEDVYRVFGLGAGIELRLSTMPLERIQGECDGRWSEAEDALQRALGRRGGEYEVHEGEGAFYAPKIDIVVKDAIGREWQCATIQLDYHLPERFGLKYQDSDGSLKVPVLVHRAILGSVERFLALLIEHTGGVWPMWLSPRQAAIIPVHDKFLGYAQSVARRLTRKGYHVDVMWKGGSVKSQIRAAHGENYIYSLVVGEEEANQDLVHVRKNVGSVDCGKLSVVDVMEVWASQVERFE